MPKYTHTEVEGRKLKISSLDKALYPGIRATKAEIIRYHLEIAPYLIPYIKNRPLTLIRFPDGINQAQFYSKSMPSGSPEWIKGVDIAHSTESIKYVVASDKASLVWLANIAALELHPMQMTTDSMEFPDHFIFDLDPPENEDFEIVKSIALKLKPFLESRGFVPFIKTSGSKGLHIYVPITKHSTHDEMTTFVKKIAREFVNKNRASCTLAMSKEKRGGKTLIDIFRNHRAHTTVAPFSLRGKEGAPISFPVPWEFVGDLESSKDINLRNYKNHLEKFGNPWEDFYQAATPLVRKSSIKVENRIVQKLEPYVLKRNLEVTPEPGIEHSMEAGNRYCIQLHDAKNLHYDLRLEQDGVLMSWAIPKGLPYVKDVKRLAIRTEDHPLQYLSFEGEIPKGSYGAGKMWVFNAGTIQWTKKKATKYSFRLMSKGFNKSFNLYKTKDDHWLIELIENLDSESIEMPLSPMLAGVSETVPLGSRYIYEIKWDGIRCIFFLENDTVKIYSRSGRDISEKFPELLDAKMFEVESGIFDGEIVSLDQQGKPIFSQVISRMHSGSEKTIKAAKKKYPATAYLFDCIMLDGIYIINESLSRRQAWLKAALKEKNIYRISEAIKDGTALYKASKELGLEGIMAKDKNSVYNIGQRSDSWLKIKHRTIAECYIAGYTAGEGDRSSLFGALHLLTKDDIGNWKYMGKVGTGFDAEGMKVLLEKFIAYMIDEKSFNEVTEDDRNSVWLNPILRCEIKYASLASSGVYREPVFIKLLAD